jgi:hypothetical protein
MRVEISIKGEKVGVFDDKQILMGRMIQLEDATGWTLPELLEQVSRGSGRGLQALVWFTQVLSGNPAPVRHWDFLLEDLEMKDLEAEDAKDVEAGKEGKPVKAVKAA